MAFWAHCGKWYFTRPFPDMIQMFKQYLYEQFLKRLTPEQREVILQRERNHELPVLLLDRMMETRSAMDFNYANYTHNPTPKEYGMSKRKRSYK